MTQIKILSTLITLMIMSSGCSRFKSASEQKNCGTEIQCLFAAKAGNGGTAGSNIPSSGVQSQNGSTGDKNAPNGDKAGEVNGWGGTSDTPPQDTQTAAGNGTDKSTDTTIDKGTGATAGGNGVVVAGGNGTTPPATPANTQASTPAGSPAGTPAGTPANTQPAGTPAGTQKAPINPPSTAPATPAGNGANPFNPFAGAPAGVPDTGAAPATTHKTTTTPTTPTATTPTATRPATQPATPGSQPAATQPKTTTTTTTTATNTPAKPGGTPAAPATAAPTKATMTPAPSTRNWANASASNPLAPTGQKATVPTGQGTQQNPAPAKNTGAATNTNAAATPKTTGVQATPKTTAPASGKTVTGAPTGTPTAPSSSPTSSGVVVPNADAAQVNSADLKGDKNQGTTTPGSAGTNPTQPVDTQIGVKTQSAVTTVKKAPVGDTLAQKSAILAVSQWKMSTTTQRLYDFIQSVPPKKVEISKLNTEVNQWKTCSGTTTFFDSNIQASTFKTAIGDNSGLPYAMRINLLDPAQYGLSTEIMGGINKKNEPIRLDTINYGFMLGYDLLTQTESLTNSLELQSSSALISASRCAVSPDQQACKNWPALKSQFEALNQSRRVFEAISYVSRPKELNCSELDSEIYTNLVVNKKSADQIVVALKNKLLKNSECMSRAGLSKLKILIFVDSPIAKPDLDDAEKQIATKAYISLMAKMVSRWSSQPKTINQQALAKLRDEVNNEAKRLGQYLYLVAPFLKFTKVKNYNDSKSASELSNAIKKVYSAMTKDRDQRLNGQSMKLLDYKSAIVSALTMSAPQVRGDACRSAEFMLKDYERYLNLFVEDKHFKTWAQQLAQEKSPYLIPINLLAVTAMNGYESKGSMILSHEQISQSLLQCFSLVQGHDSMSSETCLGIRPVSTNGSALIDKLLSSIK